MIADEQFSIPATDGKGTHYYFSLKPVESIYRYSSHENAMPLDVLYSKLEKLKTGGTITEQLPVLPDGQEIKNSVTYTKLQKLPIGVAYLSEPRLEATDIGNSLNALFPPIDGSTQYWELSITCSTWDNYMQDTTEDRFEGQKKCLEAQESFFLEMAESFKR